MNKLNQLISYFQLNFIKPMNCLKPMNCCYQNIIIILITMSFSFLVSFSVSVKASDHGWKILHEQKDYQIEVQDESQEKTDKKQVLDSVKLGDFVDKINQIQTSSGSLKLKSNDFEMHFFKNTQWKWAGEFWVLFNGTVRLKSESNRSMDLETPMAHIRFEGKDFILNYQDENGLSQLTIIDGVGWIKGIYREEELKVLANQRGSFQGIVDKDGPAFDQMLKGRKVARGDLQPLKKMAQSDLDQLKNQFELVDQKIIIKEKPKPKKGQICSEPFAKLNECVWRCQGCNCQRKRCFANGEWGDLTSVKNPHLKSSQECNKGNQSQLKKSETLFTAVCDY